MPRPLVASTLAALLGLAACDDRPASSERPGEPPRPPRLDLDAALGEAADAGGFDAAAEARKLVTELRTSRLDVAPRRVPTQRVAFGRDRLAQLTESELVLRDTGDMKELARLPITGPRRVTTLADGSVLVAAQSEVWQVPRDPGKAERYARVPLFADSLLMGDRRDKKRIWVHHGLDPRLFPYELGEAGRVETLDLIELKDADQKGLALLKDGSYVYTAGATLQRFFPGGKRWSLALPPGAEIWRILTTRRLDEIWLARSDGKLQLAQLGDSAVSVRKTLEVPGTFDIATNDTEVALLSLEARPAEGPDGGPPVRAWKLVVLDAEGQELFSTQLPLDAASTGEDWVRELTKNRGVVLAPTRPLVAVGGPTWLGVWSYRDRTQVLAP